MADDTQRQNPIVGQMAQAVLTNATMAQCDRRAVENGTPSLDLMEHAGRAVALAALGRWPHGRIMVLAGPGNNGGDAFVAARILRQHGREVDVFLLGSRDNLAPDAAINAQKWDGDIYPFDICATKQGYSLVIDGLFGSGLARPLAKDIQSRLANIAGRGLGVLAVDMPSGIDGDSGFFRGVGYKKTDSGPLPATLTVTFFCRKLGHILYPGRHYCGQVVVADIGIGRDVLSSIKPAAVANHPDLWRSAQPALDFRSHKYTRGTCVLIGSAAMPGAIVLAAAAATRLGAGMVRVFCPLEVVPLYRQSLPHILVDQADDEHKIKRLLSRHRADAFLVGPGLGQSAATRRLVTMILEQGKPTVVDADGLSSFASCPRRLFDKLHGKCVITPHEGELARIYPDLDRDLSSLSKINRADNAAKLARCCVVLKGADTVIADGQTCPIIHSDAPPSLATAGSGDLLAGLIISLLAAGMGPREASASACWHQAQAAMAIPGKAIIGTPTALDVVQAIGYIE